MNCYTLKNRKTNVCKSIDIILEDNMLYVDFLDKNNCSYLDTKILMTFEYENKDMNDLFKVMKNIKKTFGEEIIFKR